MYPIDLEDKEKEPDPEELCESYARLFVESDSEESSNDVDQKKKINAMIENSGKTFSTKLRISYKILQPL